MSNQEDIVEIILISRSAHARNSIEAKKEEWVE